MRLRLHILLVLAAACFCPDLRAQPARARKAYNAALKAYVKRDWNKAERNIRAAIKIYSGYTEACITYGEWLMARQQYNVAAAVLGDAEKTCTGGKKIFARHLAQSLVNSGFIDAALNRMPSGSKDTVWARLRRQALFIKDAQIHADTPKVYPVGQIWGINTKDPEMFPILSADGRTFYFTRRVNGSDEDFYYAKPDSCDIWQSAKPMPYPMNTLQQEAAMTISTDGHYMFYMRCDNRSISGYDQGGCDLYMAYTADSVWSVAQSFGGTINSTGYEGMPCLSSDNRELYFVSDRPGGYGGLDIWSSRFEQGRWQLPRNLGPGINTPGDETAPYVYADNQTLYFASTGLPGMGGSDLFLSRRTDTVWGKAVHLGMPLNTPFNEASLSLNRAGDTAYFSSDRDSLAGNYDIYCYRMPERFRPKQVAYVRGRVYDSLDESPLNYANIYITDIASGKELYQVQSNRGDGSYMIALPVGGTYSFMTNRINYQDRPDTLRRELITAGAEILLNPALLPNGYEAPTTDSLVMRVFFAKNSNSLTDSAKTALQATIRPFLSSAKYQLFINGYTDNTGTPIGNEQLSYTRARAVSSAMQSLAIPAEAVQVSGWGEASPLADNDTEEHRDLNRRVEVIIRR
jgi:outer membrane protein OmpA-like peptidoglycan-associated protein